MYRKTELEYFLQYSSRVFCYVTKSSYYSFSSLLTDCTKSESLVITVVGFECSMNNLDSFEYFWDDNYCSSFWLNMYSMHLHTKPKWKIYSWTLKKGAVSVISSDLLSKDGNALWFKGLTLSNKNWWEFCLLLLKNQS